MEDRTGAERREPPTLLTVKEVAHDLRVSDATIHRRINDGTLHAVRLGAVVRVPAAEITRLLEPSEQ